MDKNKLAESYSNLKYGNYSDTVINGFLAGFDACLSELSKTKVRKKTSEPELSLEAKAFVAKMFPCEPPCDSYGVCSNCCEASVLYAGYNMGLSASESIANAKIQELGNALMKAHNEPCKNCHAEASSLKSLITELEQQLKDKAENGCCIVEHGWRMEAEHKVKKLEQQLEKAESVRVDLIQTTNKLERMITKSNGISFYVRDSYQRELLNKEFDGLVEMIESMYDFQCEVEQYLKSRGEK